MFLPTQKEEFSKAWVHAVATVAGYKITRMDVDDDSVDVGIAGSRGDGRLPKAPHLDLQLKCTETDDGSGSDISFHLKPKNYDDLRDPDRHIPIILVVICVPDDLAEWLHESQSEMAMRRVAYWTTIQGAALTTNKSGKTVRIPRVNRFTVDALRSIMDRIGDGGQP